jgi:hypothetical protein
MAGKQIELKSKLCEGAFDALMSGDAEKHDATVAAALREALALATVPETVEACRSSVMRFDWRTSIAPELEAIYAGG